MPQFNWEAIPTSGGCLSCLSQTNDRGFVNTWAEVPVTAADGQPGGVRDVIFCADCIHQIARLVGGASPQETEAFAQREYDLIQETEKLKDEIQGWQQRFLGLANLDVEDFEKLAKLERVSKMVVVSDEPAPER